MHDPASSRRTPLSARGEPKQWLFGASLVVALALIAGLLAIVLLQGAATFWPRPLELATLRDGTRLLGIPKITEPFAPNAEQQARLDALRAAGPLPDFAADADGRPLRRLYRVANRELGQDPFRWLPLFDAASLERPRDALFIERLGWGPWIGTPEALVEVERVTPAAGDPDPPADTSTPAGRVTHRPDPAAPAGTRSFMRTRFLAEGADAVIPALAEALPGLARRRAEIERINRVEIGHINAKTDRWRLRLREAELEYAEATARPSARLPWDAWAALVLIALASTAATAFRLFRSSTGPPVRRLILTTAISLFAVAAVSASILERPWAAPRADRVSLDAFRARAAAAQASLQQEFDALRSRVASLEADNARLRLLVRDVTTNRLAPTRQSEPDEPLMAAQVVRVVQPNALSLSGRAAVYFSRWREFIADEPREVNTEGGVFPVIVGTVLMTLLLAVAVVPLGVIAALYLREYARQGPLTSAIRIAINNLAGVPSIVYGVFGLGFFCYSVGGYVDAGPAAPASRSAWWFIAIVTILVLLAGVALAAISRPVPGTLPQSGHRWARRLAVLAWIAAAFGLAALLTTTPYFRGLFRANLPNPTFGGRGLLWASLTLALMTLPVVIVATEEAIAAVPRSVREGSYGCGASKWQTIRRIVLPGAMPGVLTGMILAMTRGAGEVAPLMLVGVLKSVSQLPVSLEFPFLHLNRSFMHLGFHIFDLGFQSPDSDAARPLVWTTTLLLITVVVLLNVTAITIRGRLRARLRGGVF
ncbi:MAG: PstA family ABC transporter permease [Phycisphaerales bacterium]